MHNLTERMEHLTAREELQGVHNDVAVNSQNISQLRLSHENLAAHIYRHFPPMTLGISTLSTLLKLGLLGRGSYSGLPNPINLSLLSLVTGVVSMFPQAPFP